jgi:hypothetical protein
MLLVLSLMLLFVLVGVVMIVHMSTTRPRKTPGKLAQGRLGAKEFIVLLLH